MTARGVLLCDTGVLLSAADTDEPQHHVCAGLIRAHRGQLAVPVPVVPETAWLLESRLGSDAEVRFLRLITSGTVRVLDLTQDDYVRCAELVAQYADLGLGFVDASIVTVAENLGLAELATLNHRDFAVVRPRHVEAFTLLP
ncbi:MAG: PIN domain-containing protein [Mycobacteriales bacterium]|nr:PIN domain-containing protein [Mycobacteriales bacterium]